MFWVLGTDDVHSSFSTSSQIISSSLYNAKYDRWDLKMLTYLLTTEHPSQKRLTLDRTFIPRTCPIRSPADADSVGKREERSENDRDIVEDCDDVEVPAVDNNVRAGLGVVLSGVGGR